MKTSVLFLSYLLMLSIPLAAQSVPELVSWGPEWPRKKNREFNFQLFTPTADNYHLLLKTDQAPPAMMKFSAAHRLLHTEYFEAKFGYKSLQFDGLSAGPMDTIVYFSHHDIRNRRQSVLAGTFINGRLGELQRTFDYERPMDHLIRPIDFDKYNNMADVSPLYQSSDGRQVAYVQCLSPKTVNTQEEIMIALLDESSRLRWKHAFDRRPDAEYTTIIDVAVSNTGEVFLLAQLNSSKTFAAAAQAPHIAGYRTQVFRVTASGLQEIDVYLEGERVPLAGRLHLPEHEENKLIISGLYRDLATEAAMDGIFVKQISLTDARIRSQTYRFSDFIPADHAIHTTHRWQDRLALRDFFVLEDGTFGWVAEVAYTQSVASSTTQYTHELLIPLFHPEDVTARMLLLDKKYYSDDPLTTSYALSVYGNQLRFLYNTFSLDERGRKKEKGTFTMLRTLTPGSGWSEAKTIVNSRVFTESILPRRAVFTGERCYLPAYGRRAFRIGRVDFTTPGRAD